MSTLVLDAITESIRAGRDHDLHCHSMCLSARDKEMPSFQGPGVIRIGSDGQLRFTMYAESLESYPLPERGMPGDLIPDDSVFRLSAVDENQTEWISDYVPDIDVRPDVRQRKALVAGDLIDVHSREPIFPEGFAATLAESLVTLYVFDKVDIPLNATTVTDVREDGEDSPRREAKLNIARLEVAEHNFSFTRHDDLLEIRVRAPTLTPGLDQRVIEALQFVLARPIWWSILCEDSGDTTTTRIRCAPMNSARQTDMPPIQSVAFYDPTECVWALYAKYFQYILGHEEHSWHPVSRYLYSVIEAHAAGFEAYRLALSIAIEGILNAAFKTVFPLGDEFLSAVDDVEKHFREWECPMVWDGESGLRDRLTTFLRQLRKPRAVDRLWRLVELGVVTEKELGEWKHLRNKTAHAHRPDRFPGQREFDQLSIVTTLMHKLVFQAIGYSGKYTDYGTRGFRSRDFVPGRCDSDPGGD